MGSSASKGARAAGSAARKYPTRVSNATNAPTPQATAPQAQTGPPINRASPASQTKTEAINLDGRDPTFAAQLRSLGAVQPNPHFSPTSTSPLDPQRNTTNRPKPDNSSSSNTRKPSQFDLSADYTAQPTSSFASAYPDPATNPALTVLSARQRLQDQAEREMDHMGRRGFEGRSFVDIAAVRQAMLLVQKGMGQAEAERTVGLKNGRLDALGRGIVVAV